MKGLLLIAHGSRVQSSNDEVAALSVKLREKLEHQFDDVACAFLELASPDIVEGVTQSVQRGVTDLLVVPYFLAAGRHVQEDIPNEIAKCAHTGVRIRICDYIGRADGMVDLLAQLTRDAD